MKRFLMTLSAAIIAGSAAMTLAQAPNYQSDITSGKTTMTAAQQAQYKAEYQAAKAQWAKMTPEQQAGAVQSARNKKLQDLTAIELVGQRNDMQRETAAQTGALKAEADAAKAQWNKMTPEQKQAARKAAWAKKRAELNGIERVGQNDDTYVLPW